NKLLRQHTREWSHDDLDSFANTFGLTNAFGATNIPVFYSFINSAGGTNRYFGYTPSVHRLLQLTANIYDASAGTEGTNLIVLPPQSGTKTIYAPHVFRPIFRRDADNTAVYIVGYRELVNASFVLPATAPRMVDLHDPKDRDDNIPILGVAVNSDLRFEPMAYGIPLVIGAKQGLPNFNKFALQNAVTATRKLSFHREPGQPVSRTNQIYSFQITNGFGVQLWNSYGAVLPRTVDIRTTAHVTLFVTNEFGAIAGPFGTVLSNRYPVGPLLTNIAAGKWPGYSSSSAASFVIPVLTNFLFLTNSDYQQVSPSGGGVFQKVSSWDTPNTFRIPKLWLNLRAQIQVAIVDTATNRIIDYVNLDTSEAPINIIDAMRGNSTRYSGGDISDGGDFWYTNRIDNPLNKPVVDNPLLPTQGIINQIRISAGEVDGGSLWTDYSKLGDLRGSSVENFKNRLYAGDNSTMVAPADLDFAAPFQPTRTFYQYIRWEANDPLVHYTSSDLSDMLVNPDKVVLDTATTSPLATLKSLNKHYLPWDGNPVNPAETNPKTRLNSAVKDPAMLSSDGWDFPTNKLPNIGWLGRVHRGTPWQTVYLKSDDLGARGYNGSPKNWAALQVPLGASAAADTWVKWSGNQSYRNADAFHSRPVQDRMLFDIFTASLNDNSSRGRLSVNQTGLAAWSAVLSGVNVITNVKTGPSSFSTASVTIEPAAVSPALTRIVNGINRTRTAAAGTNAYVFPNARFAHVGDVLATPELTFNSPYINTNNITSKPANGLNDEIVERIPQQIISLLDIDHSPRFVIYSYGQTLRPAPQSIIRSFGAFNGMCTNYQVTAETATRAVLRMEGSFDPRDSNNSDPLLHYPPRVVVEQYNLLPPD
ncbi:MAG TPA: hypothetical protein VK327_00030, partial [Candidatus Paceibacterota bacterium]|nr:hypothetical protein [Candidatus Paceibacterota bacterium]